MDNVLKQRFCDIDKELILRYPSEYSNVMEIIPFEKAAEYCKMPIEEFRKEIISQFNDGWNAYINVDTIYYNR